MDRQPSCFLECGHALQGVPHGSACRAIRDGLKAFPDKYNINRD